MSFKEYVEHGWALCPIREGEKRPRGEAWNKRENTVTDPERAQHLIGAGLCHAFSGTCAIDIDNVDLARVWLRERGIDLDALFDDDDALQITRGDSTRGKLIYSLPSPLPTKQIKSDDKTLMLLEFRCGATTGNTAQDVLPPTNHPSGRPYEWKFGALRESWRKPPPLPAKLLEVWQSLIHVAPERSAAELVPTAHLTELRRLIEQKDPDGAYDEWLKVGQAIHHETQGGEDGLALWDEWSARSGKYPGFEQLSYKWDSFGNAPNPVTAGWLRQGIVATVADLPPPVTADEVLDIDPPKTVLQLIPAREFAQREPVRYLVEGMIEVGQLFGFIGRRKGGKSYGALDLAFCVAQGRPFAKHKVLETGPVVWIAAEGARSMRIRRLPQWLAHYGDADLRIWPHALNMRQRDTYDGLLEACAGAKLVVIDSLRRVTPGAKENSSDEIADVLAYAEQLALNTGAAVCMIAHAGKTKAEGEDMTARGTSAIEDALEAGFMFEKLDDETFRMTPGFARDEESGDDAAIYFGLKPITPEGLTPGVVVDWDKAKPVEKREEKAPKVAPTDAAAVKLLGRLWPVDGEPVIPIDAFLGAYAEELLMPASGVDNRITRAQHKLNTLAEKGIVELDSVRGTITLLRSSAKPIEDTPLAPPAPPAPLDPDEDLL